MKVSLFHVSYYVYLIFFWKRSLWEATAASNGSGYGISFIFVSLFLDL